MFNKLVAFTLQDTAVSFYRLILPLRAMKREGLTKESRITPFSGNNQFQALEWNKQLYPILCKDGDVLWTTPIYNDKALERALDLRERFQMKWIVDVDDNLFDVSKDNPASDHVKLLKAYIERCLRLADGLTVSVSSLKKVYEQYNPNIYINPNALDFVKPYYGNDPITGKGAEKSWDELRAGKKKPHKGIRIGWEGAYGHKADLELIYPVIEALQKKHDVTLVALGWQPKIPCEWHDWVEFTKYPGKLASLNLDIAVAPLIDSHYNRCKSNLRYLEFSALGIPVVLSPTENQKNMVALEASTPYEWYEQLEKLILDEKLRQDLGEQANQFVKENYDVHKVCHPLAEWLEQLQRRTILKPIKK